MGAAPPCCRWLCPAICAVALLVQMAVAQQAPVDPARQTRPRRVQPPPDKNEPPEEVIRVETLGGGGFGDPRERPLAALAADLREEKITRAAAERDYGADRVAEALALG